LCAESDTPTSNALAVRLATASLLAAWAFDEMCDLVDSAQHAGLSVAVDPFVVGTAAGVHVRVVGLSHHAGEVARLALERVVVRPPSHDARLAATLEALVRQLRVASRQEPAQLSRARLREHRGVLHLVPTLDVLRVAESLDVATARSQCLDLARAISTRGAARVLVAGNVTHTDAQSFSRALCGVIPSLARASLPPHDALPVECSPPALAPGRSVVLREVNPNPHSLNSASLVAFEIGCDDGNSARNEAMARLLAQLLTAAFFTQLRTHERLGYIAKCDAVSFSGRVALLTFLIQSVDHSAAHVSSRIHAFIASRMGLLESMSDESFATFRRACASSLATPPTSLDAAADAVWEPLAVGDEDVSRPASLVAAVRTLERAELADVWRRRVIDEATRSSFTCEIAAVGVRK
jgi:secreted Zn-dependent insulinase-like peptidase